MGGICTSRARRSDAVRAAAGPGTRAWARECGGQLLLLPNFVATVTREIYRAAHDGVDTIDLLEQVRNNARARVTVKMVSAPASSDQTWPGKTWPGLPPSSSRRPCARALASARGCAGV